MALDEFAERLPSDIHNAVAEIINSYKNVEIVAGPDSEADWDSTYYESFLDHFILLYTVLGHDEKSKDYSDEQDEHGYPVLDSLDFSLPSHQIMTVIYRAMNSIHDRNKVILSSKLFNEQIMRTKARLGQITSYHFDQDEIIQIQGIINDLRDKITNTLRFDEKHKKRLMLRLERLQQEVHKKVSDLDVFWGMIGDAGVAVGKFGQEAKPFVDRVRELAEVVWKAQARGEQIENDSGPPLLTKD